MYEHLNFWVLLCSLYFTSFFHFPFGCYFGVCLFSLEFSLSFCFISKAFLNIIPIVREYVLLTFKSLMRGIWEVPWKTKRKEDVFCILSLRKCQTSLDFSSNWYLIFGTKSQCQNVMYYCIVWLECFSDIFGHSRPLYIVLLFLVKMNLWKFFFNMELTELWKM